MVLVWPVTKLFSRKLVPSEGFGSHITRPPDQGVFTHPLVSLSTRITPYE